MISTCQLYNDNKSAVNSWQHGHFRPQSFEFALYMAQVELFNLLRKAWENSQIITDELRPFFKDAQLKIDEMPQGGIVAYPADYVSFSNLKFYSKTEEGEGVKCKGFDVVDSDNKCRPLTEEEKVELLDTKDLFERDIRKVPNNKWASFLKHRVIKPSVKNPGTTQLEGGFKVVPREIGYVVLNYLAIPERPVFAYTRDALDNIVCIPEKCTNLLWGPEALPDLMARVKTKYSSFVGDQQKYAEGVKETIDAG